MRFHAKILLCASLIFLAQCKRRGSESSTAAAVGTPGAIPSGPTEKYLCEGDRPAAAALDGSAHSRMILQRQGKRLFVQDVSMPGRADFPFQLSLSTPQPAVTYDEKAFENSPVKNAGTLNSYRAECNRFAKDDAGIPAWSKNCRAWEGDMVLLGDASLFQQATTVIYLGRAITDADNTGQNASTSRQVSHFDFIVRYQCTTYQDDADQARHNINLLREYFSLRNHVYRPYYRADWLGPYTAGTLATKNMIPHADVAVSLLQESLYYLKATRTLAGMPPRANFFTTTMHRDYHEKADNLASFKISRKQYGLVPKAAALKAFDAVTKDFEETFTPPFRPIYATLPDARLSADAAAKAFAALVNDQARFAVGTFSYRDSDCNKNAAVMVLVDRQEKTAYPLIVPVCSP